MTPLLDNNQGRCFLCQVRIGKRKQGKVLHPVNLRPICRYLQMNLEETKEEATFCGNCCPLITGWGNMIKELELLQMRVTDKFQTFHQILIMSRQTETEEQCTGNQEEQIFRTKLKKACSMKSDFLRKTTFPQVRISKRPEDVADTQSTEIETDFLNFDGTSSVDAILSSLSHRRFSEPSASASNPQNTKRRQCTLCPQPHFPRRLRVHLSEAHPEQIFFHLKFPSTPPSIFRELCLKTLDTCLKDANDHRKGSHKWSCLYCSKEYRFPGDLKHHLVLDHNSALADKLKAAQKEGTAILWPCQRPGCSLSFSQKADLHAHLQDHGNRKQCSYCPYNCPRPVDLKRHVIFKHADHHLAECKPSWQSNSLFRNEVRNLYRQEVELCPKLESGSGRQCQYCDPPRNYKGSQDLIIHLATDHRSKLVEKLKEKDENVCEAIPVVKSELLNSTFSLYDENCDLMEDFKEGDNGTMQWEKDDDENVLQITSVHSLYEF